MGEKEKILKDETFTDLEYEASGRWLCCQILSRMNYLYNKFSVILRSELLTLIEF